jgi:hypothetical protein
LVEGHLREFPETAFTPHQVGKVLTRSVGAVANALDRLTGLGVAQLVTDKARSYGAARVAADAPAAPSARVPAVDGTCRAGPAVEPRSAARLLAARDIGALTCAGTRQVHERTIPGRTLPGPLVISSAGSRLLGGPAAVLCGNNGVVLPLRHLIAGARVKKASKTGFLWWTGNQEA